MSENEGSTFGVREIVLSALGNDEEARAILYRALDASDAKSRELRRILEDHPEQVLAVLAHGNAALGLSLKGGGDVLEIALGDLAPDRARALMESYLTPKRRQELLRGRGDLPSIAADIASLDDLVATILQDIALMVRETSLEEVGVSGIKVTASANDAIENTETVRVEDSAEDTSVADEDDVGEDGSADEEPDEKVARTKDDDDGDWEFQTLTNHGMGADALALEILSTWAMKLKDRKDYEEFLQHRIGKAEIRQLLILAIAVREGSPNVPPSAYEDLGLDPETSPEQLRVMLASKQFPSMDTYTIERARALVMQRHAQVACAPETATPEEASAASRADELGDL